MNVVIVRPSGGTLWRIYHGDAVQGTGATEYSNAAAVPFPDVPVSRAGKLATNQANGIWAVGAAENSSIQLWHVENEGVVAQSRQFNLTVI